MSPPFRPFGLPVEQPNDALAGVLRRDATNPLPVAPPTFGGLGALSSKNIWDSGALSPMPPVGMLSGVLGSFAPPPRPMLPTTGLGALTATPIPVPDVKRKVYFAFDFDDLMRVNNVRQVGKIWPPREVNHPRAFKDRSIWESRNIKNEENLKNLMREAIKYSSVVCALAGTNTWNARWAKYEIARSVIDGKGLFTIHINSINHTITRTADERGISPLHVLGIYRNFNDTLYLMEKRPAMVGGEPGWQWHIYDDYLDSLPALPRYIPSISQGETVPLSKYTAEYDMTYDDGFKQIGAWIESAAIQVGR